MDRTRDFVIRYCDWMRQCLNEDEKWEELAFFELGIDLGVRQKELELIKWEQIDFPYIKNIKSIKGEYYPPKEIKYSTMKLINDLPDDREYLFSRNSRQIVESIKCSIGDSRFGGHMIRSFSVILKNGGRDYDKKRISN